MEKLTEPQTRLREQWIEWQAKGVSFREFCRRTGRNRGATTNMCKRIEAKGYVMPPFVGGYKFAAKSQQTDETLLLQHAAMQRRVSELEAENKRLNEETADSRILRHLIHGLENRKVDPPTWVAKQKKSKSRPGTPCLFWSDWHWGEVVHPAEIQGVNEYNLSIAHKRLERVVDKSVYVLRHRLAPADYPGVVVFLGGDMVSGNIHEELRQTNALAILPTLIDLLEQSVSALRYLADEFGRVAVYCVVGNHGRLDRKPRAKGAAHENYEWLYYQFLGRELSDDDRITVTVSESLDYRVEVDGHTYLLTHGDQFRGGSGITGPLLPWMRGDQKKRFVYGSVDQDYDTLIMGHWHQLTFGPDAKFVVNGSLKGYDEYAFRQQFAFQEPQQALWLTDPQYGITYPVGIYGDRK